MPSHLRQRLAVLLLARAALRLQLLLQATGVVSGVLGEQVVRTVVPHRELFEQLRLLSSQLCLCIFHNARASLVLVFLVLELPL